MKRPKLTGPGPASLDDATPLDEPFAGPPPGWDLDEVELARPPYNFPIVPHRQIEAEVMEDWHRLTRPARERNPRCAA